MRKLTLSLTKRKQPCIIRQNDYFHEQKSFKFMNFIASFTSIDIIGTSAAVLTTAAMFPQAIKIIQTQDVKSISLWMYIANTIGIVLWGSYGLLLNQKPIIYANLIAFVPATTILVLKLLYSSKDK